MGSLQSTTIHVGGSISEGSSTSAAADDDNVFDDFKVPKTANRSNRPSIHSSHKANSLTKQRQWWPDKVIALCTRDDLWSAIETIMGTAVGSFESISSIASSSDRALVINETNRASILKMAELVESLESRGEQFDESAQQVKAAIFATDGAAGDIGSIMTIFQFDESVRRRKRLSLQSLL